MTNDNKNNGNRRALELVRYSLQRDMSKKAAKGVPTSEFKKYISKKNNSDRGVLIGTTIPLVLSAGGAVLGIVTLCLSSATNELFFGANSEFLSNMVAGSKDMIKNLGALSLFNAAVPLTAALGINYKLKSKTEHYNYKLYTKKELEELKKNERAYSFVQRLKQDNNDESLNYAKNFLTNTNISGNTKEYNKELIIKLSEQRDKLLEEEPLEESLKDLREFLRNSKTSQGASPIFLESPIVKQLIDKEEQKEKEQGRKLTKKN